MDTYLKKYIEDTITQHHNKISHLNWYLDASSGFDTDAVVVAGSHHCYLEDELQALPRKFHLQKNLLKVSLKLAERLGRELPDSESAVDPAERPTFALTVKTLCPLWRPPLKCGPDGTDDGRGMAAGSTATIGSSSRSVSSPFTASRTGE